MRVPSFIVPFLKIQLFLPKWATVHLVGHRLTARADRILLTQEDEEAIDALVSLKVLDPQSISEVPRGPLNNTRGTSLMDRASKTAKESKHRGLFCI
ncbi:hypothetical protein MTR_5g099380 [Medicago truncatula]|uniref:Uncharacterized protein n=1 Tax=Medicago truncatula TaxID=3880 RepID=G7KFH8_MEDTR|nr:hypothetical protein MTR_5g099380 [Medicago truncatula]